MNFLEYLQDLLEGNTNRDPWLRGGYPQASHLGTNPLRSDDTPFDPYSPLKEKEVNLNTHKDLLWALELEKRQRPHTKYMGYNSMLINPSSNRDRFQWKSDIPLEQYDPPNMNYLQRPLQQPTPPAEGFIF